MGLINFINEQGIVIVPVLYIIGMIFKGIKKFPDKFIPLTLLVVGCGVSFLMFGFTVSAFIQGVLLTGFTVYGNQIIKQLGKDE